MMISKYLHSFIYSGSFKSSLGQAVCTTLMILCYLQLLVTTKYYIQHYLGDDSIDMSSGHRRSESIKSILNNDEPNNDGFTYGNNYNSYNNNDFYNDNDSLHRKLVGYRSTCNPHIETCSSLYFLSGVMGKVSVDLRFTAPIDQDESTTYFEDAVFKEKAEASVTPFSSVDFFVSSITDLNPNSVLTVKGSVAFENISANKGSIMMVASQYTGNELWMYSDNDLTEPCSIGETTVVLGNSVNDGETLYSLTPAGVCSKLEMDRNVGPPLSFCQRGNFTWNIYSNFQCNTKPLASSEVISSHEDNSTVFCVALGSDMFNSSLQCVSGSSVFSKINLDDLGRTQTMLPHFLQNNMPIIGGSGAGAILCFLLLLVGVHKYQKSGLVDFTVGDVVIYKLTPAQQKRQRIHNLTKGYDYIKDRGFALVVSVPAPSFLSYSDMKDPDASSLYKKDYENNKSILCLQPLKRVARPVNASGGGSGNFFSQQVSPQERGNGFSSTANTAISLIREGEMEIELVVDESQKPVSSNYWGIRGGRVLSVVPIIWRRRIKLDVKVDTAEVEARRRKVRKNKTKQHSGSNSELIENTSNYSDATASYSNIYPAPNSRDGSRSLGDDNNNNNSSNTQKGSVTRKLDLLSFLDVTYTTNPVTGKGEWVNRSNLINNLRRRSPSQRGADKQNQDMLSPLPNIGGNTASSNLGGRKDGSRASIRVTDNKINVRDAKFERRETKRLEAMKDKRMKRESVRRTILTANNKSSGETGLWGIVRASIFSNSMTESERKRMTKIQDESVRLSSLPRKLRKFAGRNDLPILFGGKELSKKLWEDVAKNDSDREEEEEDDEDWWKDNSYEAEGLLLQPFLKSISRSETIKGRQCAIGMAFSYVVENCKELELDKIAYSVWNYPYTPEDEEYVWEEDEFYDAPVEEVNEDTPVRVGEVSDEEEEEEDDKFEPRDVDVTNDLELLPPEEERSHRRHRLRIQQSEQDGVVYSDESDEEHQVDPAYEDFQKKSNHIREVESAQKIQKSTRKLTKMNLDANSLTQSSGLGTLPRPNMSSPSPLKLNVSPFPNSVDKNKQQQQQQQHLSPVLNFPSPGSNNQLSPLNMKLQPLVSPMCQNNTPLRQQQSQQQHQQQQQQQQQFHQHQQEKSSFTGDTYVTPPHRMKSIVSRTTKVGGTSGQSQAALSNDSTKSNSADKQYLMRVGDGLAVQNKEFFVSSGAVNESSKDRERARHRNNKAEEQSLQRRQFAEQEQAFAKQNMFMKTGSSLESDDDVDGAVVRRLGEKVNQGRQQVTPLSNKNLKSTHTSPARQIQEEISTEGKQRRTDRRKRQDDKKQPSQQGTRPQLEVMDIEDFD